MRTWQKWESLQDIGDILDSVWVFECFIDSETCFFKLFGQEAQEIRAMQGGGVAQDMARA